MRSSWISAIVLSFAMPAALLACQSEDEGFVVAGDHHAHAEAPERERVSKTSAALSPNDPVEALVTSTCDTSPINPLATQLIAEVECLSPGAMSSIKDLPNIRFTPGEYVFPFMQTFAVNSLKKVVAARGSTLSINSGLRSLPEQYVLYRYYQTGRCGIRLAAPPGSSNHESGLAVDVQDNAGWRSYFLNQGWAWQGEVDPVHYDIAGGVNMKGLSVRAFQRLWNRNNPNELIDEDGIYGAQTESKITKSPIGGFPVGAVCNDKPDAGTGNDAGSDSGTTVSPETPETPDETNGNTITEDGGTAGGDNQAGSSSGSTKNPLGDSSPSESCSASRVGGGASSSALLVGLAAVGLAFARRRRS